MSENRSNAWIFAVLLLLWSTPWAGAQTPETLEKSLAEVTEAPRFETASWGMLVVDAKTKAVLYERDADKLFCPASVTKVFSCAAMLATFGADFRFETPIHRIGTVDGEGRLQGVLVLRAMGDPNLTGRLTDDGRLIFNDSDHIYSSGSLTTPLLSCDPLVGFLKLAQSVNAAGIKSVDDVLVDDRLFDIAVGSGSGPSTVTPIVVNDNVVDATVTPGDEVGAPAKLALRPVTDHVTVDFRVTTCAADATSDLSFTSVGNRRYVVSGKIARGSAAVSQILIVDDPTAFARALLIDCLRRSGVLVAASGLADQDRTKLPGIGEYAALPIVAKHVSPPLIDALKVCLKVSHNLHASTWPMLLAVKSGQRTLDDGMAKMSETLRSLGVDTKRLSFSGAAGGMPGDMATPRRTVELLSALAARDDAAHFRAALPILGVDGTLVKSVAPDSPARGRIQAKTGTMGYTNRLDGSTILRAKALAGYMTTKSGRELIFTFFVNDAPLYPGFDSTAVGKSLGRLCEIFYDAF